MNPISHSLHIHNGSESRQSSTNTAGRSPVSPTMKRSWGGGLRETVTWDRRTFGSADGPDGIIRAIVTFN